MPISFMPQSMLTSVSLPRGIALAIVIAGCGPGLARRYEIHGTVTYQGKPVESGCVSFEPLAGPNADAGPRGIGGGFAHIRGGRYDTAAAGRGHVGGPHRVTVVGVTSTPPASSAEPVDFASGQPLFDPYEFTVDLPCKSQQLDIKVPGP